MYKCPLAGGCLVEVSGGGSCLCMVNRQHFWKVTAADWEDGGGSEEEDWTAVAVPTSPCWLRANARSGLCIYVFFSPWRVSALRTFEAKQRHIWRDRCTRSTRGRGHGLRRLFVKLYALGWFCLDLRRRLIWSQTKQNHINVVLQSYGGSLFCASRLLTCLGRRRGGAREGCFLSHLL